MADELDLGPIEQRVQAITPPPWLLMPEVCGPEGQGISTHEDRGLICEVGDPYPRGRNRPQENMTFLVHAADDMAALLTEVRRLRALVASEQARTLDLKQLLRLESDDHRWARRVTGPEGSRIASWQCLLCDRVVPGRYPPPSGQPCPWRAWAEGVKTR